MSHSENVAKLMARRLHGPVFKQVLQLQLRFVHWQNDILRALHLRLGAAHQIKLDLSLTANVRIFKASVLMDCFKIDLILEIRTDFCCLERMLGCLVGFVLICLDKELLIRRL